MKKAFQTSTGEVKFVPCGRRTCPRCRGSYAYELGEVLSGLHGKIASHLVLTVDPDHINLFATERDYVYSKAYTRELARHNLNMRKARECLSESLFKRYIFDHPAPLADDSLLEARKRIADGSQKLCDSIRKMRDELEARIGHRPGYCRSVEYGEHHTHRFHAHVVLMFDMPYILDLFRSHKFDADRGLYVSPGDPIWRYGMVRIKPVDSAKGAIAYVSEYASKSSPGRIAVDLETQDLRVKRKRLYKTISSESSQGEVQYFNAGKDARQVERDLDTEYEKLRRRLKNEENANHQRRRSHQNSTSEVPRRIQRIAKRRPGTPRERP